MCPGPHILQEDPLPLKNPAISWSAQMRVELPILRVEQELWKLVSKHAQRRPEGVRLTRTTKHIRAPSSGQGPHLHLTRAGSTGDPRASYFSLSDLCFSPAFRAHSVFPTAEDDWEAHIFLQHETFKYIKTAQLA